MEVTEIPVRAYNPETKSFASSKDTGGSTVIDRMLMFWSAMPMARNPKALLFSYDTGVTDKNKVCIWSGDIIEVIDDLDKKFLTEVRYKDGAFLVEYDFGEGDIQTIYWAIELWESFCKSWLVVGNIYQNPELVEQMKK